MLDSLFNPINLVAMLTTLYLGLLANSVSAAVWVSQVKVRSGAFLLSCLSIIDALFCSTFSIPVLMALMQLYIEPNCYDFLIILPFTVFGNASRFLTVAVMTQRWLAVSRPLAVTRLFSFHRQVVMMTYLLLLSLIFLGMSIYIIHLTSTLCFLGDYNSTEELKILDYFPWLFIAWNALLLVALVMFGILLLYSTFCRVRNVLTIYPQNTNRPWQRTFKMRTTVMVLCMAAFSLLDTFLFIFLNLVKFKPDVINFYRIEYLIIPYVWVTIVNCSINFLLYSCFGRDFRSILRRQWTACWTRFPTSQASSRITAATSQRLSVKGGEN